MPHASILADPDQLCTQSYKRLPKSCDLGYAYLRSRL